MDLLEYAQQLVARENTSTQTQAHNAYLQQLVKSESPQKIEVKETNSQTPTQNSNTYLLITGLTLFGLAILATSY
jgi:hypothetical protein